LTSSEILRMMYGSASYQACTKKLTEGRQKADFFDFSLGFLRHFFGSSRSRHEEIPNLTRTCVESFPNLSRTIPEQFPNSFRTIPEQFPNNSRTVPEQLPNSTRTTPEQLQQFKAGRCALFLAEILAGKSLRQCPNFSFQLIQKLKKHY